MAADPVSDAFAQFNLPLSYLEAQLNRWLDTFPAEALRRELAELEKKRGTIEAAIEALNRQLLIWQTMRTRALGMRQAELPSKRDVVLALLERDESREFSIVEIRESMIEGGLLEDTPKARHALEATISNMVKRGEIERPHRGHYRLAAPKRRQKPPSGDPQPADPGAGGDPGAWHSSQAPGRYAEQELTRW